MRRCLSPIAAGPLAWGGLLAFLAVMIVVDLKVGSAQRHMTVRTAAVWSAIWVALARRLRRRAVAGSRAPAAGEAYFAGYVMEKALSLDNVFVFTLIFAALAVPREEQPRVLLWGILIALVLRAIFIFAGAEALETYSWVAWPFAALLAWTGWRILRRARSTTRARRSSSACERRFPRLEAGGRRAARGRARRRDLRRRLRAGDPRDHDRHVHRLRAPTRSPCSACARCSSSSPAPSRGSPTCNIGLGVLLIAIAGKLVYGEVTGEKVPTSLTLGVDRRRARRRHRRVAPEGAARLHSPTPHTR